MFTLASPAFPHGGTIPAQFTCAGADDSPPLAWDHVPDGTRSFVLVVDDPDAPDPAAPKRIWVHWLLWDIPPHVRALDEGASPDALPHGAREGAHDGGGTGWSGPCPPIGRHRYFFRLHALDATLRDLAAGAGRAELERAMQGHVLASAELMGTFSVGDRELARR